MNDKYIIQSSHSSNLIDLMIVKNPFKDMDGIISVMEPTPCHERHRFSIILDKTTSTCYHYLGHTRFKLNYNGLQEHSPIRTRNICCQRIHDR